MKYYLLLLGIIIVFLACIMGVGCGLYLVLHALFMWSSIAGGIGLGLVVIYLALSLLALCSSWIDRFNAK